MHRSTQRDELDSSLELLLEAGHFHSWVLDLTIQGHLSLMYFQIKESQNLHILKHRNLKVENPHHSSAAKLLLLMQRISTDPGI
ncbi:hypothetical protein LWI29_023571 [Acer saccharum]|uniref:Uncharacterized protein n=1 Tax=Acer saccharum TaxID=4024 RepID=A0AA39SEF0_ACESA|nr:hypothetical protein LWI29_023571 [Acer saccharum]